MRSTPDGGVVQSPALLCYDCPLSTKHILHSTAGGLAAGEVVARWLRSTKLTYVGPG